MTTRSFGTIALVVAAALVGTGISYAGIAVERGLSDIRTGARTVTVKGLSERKVNADYMTWTLGFNVTGNDLPATQAAMQDVQAKVLAFLQNSGLKQGEDFRLRPWQVADNRGRLDGNNQPLPPFQISAAAYIASHNIAAVEKVAASLPDLLSQGVIAGDGSVPVYLFTKLNDLKPEMLAEATQQARVAAQQFATDSGAVVGNIKTANQGLFSIRTPGQDYDDGSQSVKVVRVVTTVEYSLE